MIESAVNVVVSMMLIILIGYWLADKSVFKDYPCDLIIGRFMHFVVLPVYMFNTVIKHIDGPNEFLHILSKVPFSFMIIAIVMLLSRLLSVLLRIDVKRRGLFVNASTLTNVLYFGFPIVEAVFGQNMIPVALVYYIANTITFWTLGNYFLASDRGSAPSFFTRQNAKMILTSPLIGLVLGFAVISMNIRIPLFLSLFASNLGNTCGTLGLLFIGITIRKASLTGRSFAADLIWLGVIRFLVAPFLLGAMIYFLPLNNDYKRIFYLMSLMPAMTQLPIMSRQLGSDHFFASVWTTISILINMAEIPAVVYLMERLFPI